MEGKGYLCEQVLHLSLFGPEAFNLLVYSWILLQFYQGGPFAVQVGTDLRQEETIKVN